MKLKYKEKAFLIRLREHFGEKWAGKPFNAIEVILHKGKDKKPDTLLLSDTLLDIDMEDLK